MENAKAKNVHRPAASGIQLLVRARGYPVRLVLAGLLVAVLCVAGSPPALDDRAAWREACALSRYSCFGLSPPAVVEAPLGLLNGRYKMGQKYILVDENLPPRLTYAVKVHEMTHYLQYKRKAWKFTTENRCRMEKEAFDASNRVLRRLHDDRNVVDWDVMKALYGCTL